MSLHVAFFLLALALICVHEMDAMRCHEWRIFPLISQLEDRTGMLVFVWAHVPIFWLVFARASASVEAGGDRFSIGFCVFCVLHALAHWVYERHPACEFCNTLSRSIIWGCAAAGFAGLAASRALLI